MKPGPRYVLDVLVLGSLLGVLLFVIYVGIAIYRAW